MTAALLAGILSFTVVPVTETTLGEPLPVGAVSYEAGYQTLCNSFSPPVSQIIPLTVWGVDADGNLILDTAGIPCEAKSWRVRAVAPGFDPGGWSLDCLPAAMPSADGTLSTAMCDEVVFAGDLPKPDVAGRTVAKP